MEEDISVKKRIYPEIPGVADLEVVPYSDSLKLSSACTGHPIKESTDSIWMSSKPLSQHLDGICLSIRIAIIRCFYSSSSCPATALQMLKEEEDNNLCITVNLEDINFFVQKFEKTGSVIGNLMDSSNLVVESIKMSNEVIIETVIDNALENEAVDESNEGIYYPTDAPFLPNDDTLKDEEQSPSEKVEESKREEEIVKKNQSTINCPQIFRLQLQDNKNPIKEKTFPNLNKNIIKISKKSASLWNNSGSLILGRNSDSRSITIISSDLLKKRKRDQGVNGTLETLQRPQSKKKSMEKEASAIHSEVESEMKVQRFSELCQNQCRICRKICPDIHALTYHILNHFNLSFLPINGPHKCPACQKEFPFNYNLYSHLFRGCNFEKYDFSQHKENPRLTDGSFIIANLSFCKSPNEDDCPSLEQSRTSLQDQVEQLSEPSANENKGTTKKIKIKTKLECSRCSKVLPDINSLTYHVVDHFDLAHLNGDKPYKCPGCTYLFQSKSTLYKHLRNNSCITTKKRAQTPFKCDRCSRAFQFELQLEHHLLVHEGKAKLNICHICGKNYKDNFSGFRYHLVTVHSDKWSYKCDTCSRIFMSSKAHEEHKLSHSGIYIYNCEICGKNYDTSGSYREHLKRHQNQDRWQCKLCGKDFSALYCYKRHMSVHSKDIVASCEFCGKGFGRKDHFKTHRKSCQKKS